MTCRNCSGVSLVAGTAVPMPALLTRMSTRPNSSIARATRLVQESGSATSVATVSARLPACSTSRAVSASRSTRRAPSARSAPASARPWANATPRPLEAPVTTATRPSRRNMSVTVMVATLRAPRGVLDAMSAVSLRCHGKQPNWWCKPFGGRKVTMDGLEEIIEEFLVESHENLDQLDRDLVALERQPDSRDLLSSVFRTLHTIKGTSGFLAFGTLESVTHVGESLLSRLRDGELTLDPRMTTVMLEMVDAVRTLLADIERTGTEGERDYADLVARLNAILSGQAPAFAEVPAVAAGAALPAPEVPTVPAVLFDEPDEPASDEPRRSLADSTIRVDVGLLDSLMNLVGELVLTRNQMLQRAAAHEDVELQRTTHRLNLIAGELQEGVMKTRMQPIDNVWSKLPRVVRDLSVLLGKDVQLRMEGADTELDKTILEAVRDPLTHLVRNAVDHGVESGADRVATGKPAAGTL